MNKYEAMVIIKPDLSEADRKALLNQINDVIAKHNGNITQSAIWSEKRKLCFPIKRYHEAVYYLVSFNSKGEGNTDIMRSCGINENILRTLITRV